MVGKYQPLKDRLAALAAAGQHGVELDFAEIAIVVGGLPPSAYDNRQWWANSSSGQAQAWRDADWHVDRVDFGRQRVRYTRGQVGGSYRVRGHRPVHETAAAPLVTESDSAHLDVRVHMTWQRAGHVTLDAGGELLFPTLPRSPGIYRLTMSDGLEQELPSVYVGESYNLRKRAYNYRRPGPSQQTSQRIHDELRTHLGAGGVVTLAVSQAAIIEAGGVSSPLPLARKTARVLAEHAALALIYLGGDAVVINQDQGVDLAD